MPFNVGGTSLPEVLRQKRFVVGSFLRIPLSEDTQATCEFHFDGSELRAAVGRASVSPYDSCARP